FSVFFLVDYAACILNTFGNSHTDFAIVFIFRRHTASNDLRATSRKAFKSTSDYFRSAGSKAGYVKLL
ncbi:MAG: hypothetical protein WBH03_14310, partial [Cyclobacteriaceae bacterium]